MLKSTRKTIEEIAKELSSLMNVARRTVFVSGNFNVVHPGHLRFLRFAKSNGDYLIVSVTPDEAGGVFISEDLRLEGIRNLSVVDYSFILPSNDIDACLRAIQPNVVVKGKEYEDIYNIEEAAVKSYGGELLFSSGEIRFSSMDLLYKEQIQINRSTINKPVDFLTRHQTSIDKLIKLVYSFNKLKILVIGDLIIDEYIECDPLGISQEDPTIVVTPIKNDIFVGGAGIVAAHAQGMGVQVKYFGVVGVDKTAAIARDGLKKHKVDAFLFEDRTRVTTHKQRYRCRGKTLLRVSHLDQHGISKELGKEIILKLSKELAGVHLLVFSDFNYGCLPQFLVDDIIHLCKKKNIPMVADSQSSSQVGDISRYTDMHLLTPTEHEARLAIREADIGLAALAEELRIKARSKNIFITMGGEGVLIESLDESGTEIITDQLAAFNSAPKDVAGAGDSLLICASLTLTAGGSGWEAAYLGSIAAACQVGRVGNFPLTADEILQELKY